MAKDPQETEFIRMHAAQVLVTLGVPGGREAALELRRSARDPFVVRTLDRLLRGEGSR